MQLNGHNRDTTERVLVFYGTLRQNLNLGYYSLIEYDASRGKRT